MCIVRLSHSGGGSTMGLEDDPRVTATKELLQGRLESVFDKTSKDCHDKLWPKGPLPIDLHNLPAEVVFGPNYDTIIRSAISQWKEQSLLYVTAGYKSLIRLIWQIQRDAATSADIAMELAWEAVDEAFGWTGADKTGSTRFEEWQRLATLLDVPVFEQLNRDFLLLFERHLNNLRLEAISSAPTAHSMDAASAEPARPEVLLGNRALGPYVDDPDVYPKDKKDKKVVGIARARLVDRIKRELDELRPEFERHTDLTGLAIHLEELAVYYPNYVIFQERRAGKLLLLRGNSLQNKAYKDLAYEIAAARARRAVTTMETAWNRYHKYLDSETK